MKTFKVGKVIYHKKEFCPICDSINRVIIMDITAGEITEAITNCPSCGHSDKWEYGFYQSIVDPISVDIGMP